MRMKTRVIVALLPLAITLGGWKLSILLNDALDCVSVGKDPQPCMLLNVNIQLALSLASWWGMLLWIPGLIISGLMIGQVLSQIAPKPWGGKNGR
jgi:hypothetical protein